MTKEQREEMIDQKREEIIENMPKNIKEFGFQSTYVFADETNDAPPYLYTTGLNETFNHPEIVVFGLSGKQSHIFVDTVVNQLIRLGRKVDLNVSSRELFSGPTYFAEVLEDAKEAYFGLGLEYAERKKQPFNVIQMFWSDRRGVFPFEDGFEDEFKGRQSIISAV